MTLRRNVRPCFLVVISTLVCFGLQAIAGKLDKVRDAVRGDSTRSSSDQDSSDDCDSLFNNCQLIEEDIFQRPCDSCRGGMNPWWLCMFPPVGLLVCLPMLIVESPEDSSRQWYQDWIPGAYFVSRPYANGHRGYLYTTGRICSQEPLILEDTFDSFAAYDPGAEALNRRKDLSSWSLRLAAEYAYDYDPVHRPNISASFDSIYRIGLATRWTHYIEPLSSGDSDQITIGDLNLTIRVAQSEIAEVRMGLGWRIIHDGQVSSGFNLAYFIDVFPVDPLVFSIAGDLGNLGRALYLHGRLSLGAQLGPVEPYLGYDLVLIEGTSVGVVFQGPVAGLRIWL